MTRKRSTGSRKSKATLEWRRRLTGVRRITSQDDAQFAIDRIVEYIRHPDIDDPLYILSKIRKIAAGH